jgi:hypothetical protein
MKEKMLIDATKRLEGQPAEAHRETLDTFSEISEDSYFVEKKNENAETFVDTSEDLSGEKQRLISRLRENR